MLHSYNSLLYCDINTMHIAYIFYHPSDTVSNCFLMMSPSWPGYSLCQELHLTIRGMSCKAVNFTMIIPCCRWGAQTVNSSKLTTSVDMAWWLKWRCLHQHHSKRLLPPRISFKIITFIRYAEAWILFITQQHKQQLYKIDHALSVAGLSSVSVPHFLVLSSRFKLCIRGCFLIT